MANLTHSVVVGNLDQLLPQATDPSANPLLDAAVYGKLEEVTQLLPLTTDSASVVHALIGAIAQGNTEVAGVLLQREGLKVSLFNNAALKWALAKQNNIVASQITAHPSFNFGTHQGILLTAVKANNAGAAGLALQCPTLNFTKEFLNDCVTQAMKRDHFDVLAVLLEDNRCEIGAPIVRYLFEAETITDETRTKLFRAMLNNPSYHPSSRELLQMGFHKKATIDMRRMAFLQDPECNENSLATELLQAADLTLFKLNYSSDAKAVQSSVGPVIVVEVPDIPKIDWSKLSELVQHKKNMEEVFNFFIEIMRVLVTMLGELSDGVAKNAKRCLKEISMWKVGW